jgi:type II secretory pathway pseudopilin PulG
MSEHIEIQTHDVDRPKRSQFLSAIVKILAVLAVIMLLVALLLPAMRSAREPARRNQCLSQLKQIALAMHTYAEVHGEFPPAYTTDADGKPLHSWRTLILPYMEERQLYASIDLTKPWDDPVNAKAFKTHLENYQCPSEFAEPDNRTGYLAVVTPESVIRATEPRKREDLAGKSKSALMVIEVGEEHAVPWMSPVDADEAMVLGLGQTESATPHSSGMNAALADGRGIFLQSELSKDSRRALISLDAADNAALSGND